MATTLTKKKYEESEKVKEAFQNYTDYKDNGKPKDYTFSDAELLTQTQNEFFNKEKFSYDLESDPLYNQYKKSYIEQGKQAMEDSVGNAAALSGGYSNSYAQTVGAKAYNSYLDKLNNVIPELYEAAYSRYNDELKNLENKLGYLSDKNKEEYSRYLDSYSHYSDEVNALRDLYLTEYKNDMAIQDSEWESAYKLAMKEQEKELAEAENQYKYYVADLEKQQFDEEQKYKYYAADLEKQQFDEEQKYKYYTADLEKQQFDAKLAAEQAQFDAELAAEKAYKYYAANLEKQQADAKLAAEQAQFDAKLEYQKTLDAQEDKYREQELRIERQKVVNANQQFWAEFDEKTKDYISQNELYIMQANGQLYDVMSALDYNYEDESTVRYKALVMGIDEDYIDSYFEAKYKGR